MLDLTRALVTEPHIITRTFYASPDPFSQDKVDTYNIYNIYISTISMARWGRCGPPRPWAATPS